MSFLTRPPDQATRRQRLAGGLLLIIGIVMLGFVPS